MAPPGPLPSADVRTRSCLPASAIASTQPCSPDGRTAAGTGQAVHDDRVRRECALRRAHVERPGHDLQAMLPRERLAQRQRVRQRSRTVNRAARGPTASAAIASRLVSALPTMTTSSGPVPEGDRSTAHARSSRTISSRSSASGSRSQPPPGARQVIAAAPCTVRRGQGFGQPEIGFQVLVETPKVRVAVHRPMMPRRPNSCQAGMTGRSSCRA